MSLLQAALARRGYFALSLFVLALDQATKALAHEYLPGEGPLVVIPGFLNLWYSRNPGGLFGYFAELPAPWRPLLLTLLPLVVILLLAGFLVRSEATARATRFGMALILGGATGNLVDRVFRGEVVDFLDVYAAPSAWADRLVDWFGTAHWPTFNVADSAIVIGAGLLLLDAAKPRREAVPVAPM